MSALRLLSLSTLMVFSLSASPIIQYQVVTTGSTGTYTYSLSGFDYRANQPCSNNAALLCDDVLDIQFAVAPPPQQPPVTTALPNRSPTFTLRHSITITDYTVRVWRDVEISHDRGKWIPVHRLGRVALTGLAQKILRKAEIL